MSTTLLQRRLDAKKQLEKQLKRGTKPAKTTGKPQIALTEKDIKKIQRQIDNINKKIE